MDNRLDMSAITNEGLSIEIKNLSLQIADLKLNIANNTSTFVARDVYEIRAKQTDLKIFDIEQSIRKASASKWVQNTLSAILGAVLAILVTFFFTHLSN